MARNRRQLEDNRRGASYEEDPVVTYSRLEADRLGSPHGIDDRDPDGPVYEAVEVPHIERPPPRDAFVREPELRVERDFDDRDPFEPEKPRRLRFLLLIGIGAIAVAAGIGVLLASFGSSTRVDTAAPGTVPASDVPAATTDTVRTNGAIREIPLGASPDASGGTSVPASRATLTPEPAAATAEPPAPRPRPDAPATTAVTVQPDQPGEPVPAALPTPPAESGAATAAAPAETAAPAGGDDFINRIERTLNRIDGPAPTLAPATPAPAIAATPQTLPTDVLNGPAGADSLGEVIIEDDAMMETGGHFDFEIQGGPDAPGTADLGPLPTPPGTFDSGVVLGAPGADPAVPGAPVTGPTPPGSLTLDGFVVEQPAPPPPPPARAGPLKRLFPRLLPQAEEPVQPPPAAIR